MAAWQNFYVIVGSSAAALIGIQFVVMTLIAGARTRTTAESIGAFGTPTVVHLTGALIVSALMSAPWPSVLAVSMAVSLCGVVGLAYTALAIRRALRQTVYRPVWEDWIWHGVLPCVSYLVLAVAALDWGAAPLVTVFAIAAAALGLLLIGIHNAWDTVTHLIISNASREATPGPIPRTRDNGGV